MDDVHLERNKTSAAAFYDLMFNQNRPAEAIARYVGASYTQHNPGVGDGKEAFIASVINERRPEGRPRS